MPRDCAGGSQRLGPGRQGRQREIEFLRGSDRHRRLGQDHSRPQRCAWLCCAYVRERQTETARSIETWAREPMQAKTEAHRGVRDGQTKTKDAWRGTDGPVVAGNAPQLPKLGVTFLLMSESLLCSVQCWTRCSRSVASPHLHGQGLLRERLTGRLSYEGVLLALAQRLWNRRLCYVQWKRMRLCRSQAWTRSCSLWATGTEGSASPTTGLPYCARSTSTTPRRKSSLTSRRHR